MSKFKIGDRVQMDAVPFVVEVLEIKPCDEPHYDPPHGYRPGDGCDMGDGQVFRFRDPLSGAEDWMHTMDFERV